MNGTAGDIRGGEKVFVTGRTDVGQERQNNEDCYLIMGIDHTPTLFAVADGMGGHSGGEVASSMAIEKTRAFFIQHRDRLIESTRQDIRAFFTHMFEGANRSIWEKALSAEQLKGMGTTLTAAVLTREGLHIGHIGDSRAYIIRSREISQVTEDHSYVQKLVNENQLQAGEEKNHPKQNLLIRALGTDRVVEVDIYHHSLEKMDRVLLCTDGLTRMVSDEEILDIVISCSVPEAVDRLISTANTRGGPDNITVLLAELNSESE